MLLYILGHVRKSAGLLFNDKSSAAEKGTIAQIVRKKTRVKLRHAKELWSRQTTSAGPNPESVKGEPTCRIVAGRAVVRRSEQFERAAAIGLGAMATTAGVGHGVTAAVFGRCPKDIRHPRTIRGRTGMPSTARSESFEAVDV